MITTRMRDAVDLVLRIEEAVAERYGDGHAAVPDVRRVHREFQGRVDNAVRVYCALLDATEYET